jgi:hypothetical protein
VDEALDRLTERDQGADEDREHDRNAGPALAAGAPQVEGDPERDCRQCVAEVVDEVGQKRDAQRPAVNERLRQRGHGQDCEAPRHRPNPCARPQDGTVDQPVRVVVLVSVIVLDQFLHVRVLRIERASSRVAHVPSVPRSQRESRETPSSPTAREEVRWLSPSGAVAETTAS